MNDDRRTLRFPYQWIEKKLLQIPISDHRKRTIDLVLAHFLVVIKHLSFEESYIIIKDWIVRCNAIVRLKPSIEYFDSKLKAAINNSFYAKQNTSNITRKYREEISGVV